MRVDYIIHKAVFTFDQKMELEVPIGSKIVHIAEQEIGCIQIWYERPLIAPGSTKVQIYCFGTGQGIDTTNLRAKYFRTVVMRNGLVWHFYISTEDSMNDELEVHRNNEAISIITDLERALALQRGGGTPLSSKAYLALREDALNYIKSNGKGIHTRT